jgi:hypothetical protein
MSTENNQNSSELTSELNRLGENLANLLRAAWESEERRSVEREITTGLEQMNKKLADAADQIRHDAALNQARRSAKEAWETAHGPQVLNELRMGVLDTLKAINADLARRAAPAQEASSPRAEEVVVEGERKKGGVPHDCPIIWTLSSHSSLPARPFFVTGCCTSLHVEQEVHDVAVLDDVFLAFGTQASGRANH